MKHPLLASFSGQFLTDPTTRTLYATDASAYREMPIAVAFPESNADIEALIALAKAEKTTLIPRTAGTSLAGQVVGNGIIVDVSKTYTQILEINTQERWVRLQPGVIRDELNLALKPYGLYFGPETSTANRAMIGGMVGNNSCGSNSIVYGSTRDHLLEVSGYLSDGSFVTFHDLTASEFQSKCSGDPNALETKIYQHIQRILSDPENQSEIRAQFPKRSIRRRNTGYAIDELLETAVFTPSESAPFNFCRLIAGSEGTLMFITEIKLHVDPVPPAFQGVLAVHCQTVDESLRANLVALPYQPSAVELMDHYILECTKANKEQSQNRFFVQGDPGAILCVEISRDSLEEIQLVAQQLEADLRAANLGYHFPLVTGDDIKKVWTLRKAGLGLLSNLPGDEKAVAVIEDTAVDVQDLPEFIREFNQILAQYGMYSVHYAHAGTGELHLRPIINLKTEEGHRQFRTIAEEISTLVKKYQGSLSGEHGDGRLRGEFIQQQIGPKNYALIQELKRTWDPHNLFNANKIVDTPPMDQFLRYEAGQTTPEFPTMFRFTDQNILQHAEQCNGSGDCRKTHLSGGTMCPSFMATRNEKDTTRARANILRETLTRSTEINRFDSEAIKDVMDLCLACKGCKSECPSNVDVAKLKMEFLHQYQQVHGVPLRSRLVGNFSRLSELASYFPWAYNAVMGTPWLRKIANRLVGFHPERSMPLLHRTTFQAWLKQQKPIENPIGQVYLFCDEFTNYNDVHIGQQAFRLLQGLGYQVLIPTHVPSGRAYLSKGMLTEAKKLAEANVRSLAAITTDDVPLIGLEPSAILTFRDEYPELVDASLAQAAKELAQRTWLIDEWLVQQMDQGKIKKSQFTETPQRIRLHGHCQQKAVGSLVATKKMLSFPKNYETQLIPSGCCGMAGSFGYEAEHYDLSMKIGELVLFPTIRKEADDVIIAAPGTSCRHQIHDGTAREAKHPVEILWEALI